MTEEIPMKRESREVQLSKFDKWTGPEMTKAIIGDLNDFIKRLKYIQRDLQDADQGIALAYHDLRSDLEAAKREKDRIVRNLNYLDESWDDLGTEAEKRKERLTEGFRSSVNREAVAQELRQIAGLMGG